MIKQSTFWQCNAHERLETYYYLGKYYPLGDGPKDQSDAAKTVQHLIS